MLNSFLINENNRVFPLLADPAASITFAERPIFRGIIVEAQWLVLPFIEYKLFMAKFTRE